jgi:linoleate 10R-lipoxygenase
VNKALCEDEQLQKWSNTVEEITMQLLESKTINAISATTKYIDIVKDVVNLVPVYFIANEIVRDSRIETSRRLTRQLRSACP